MIVVLLIVALIVVLASLLVGAIRRRKARTRQDELPFPADPGPLEDAGLLVRVGRHGKADGYAPTAVGEAALRVWLGAPLGDFDVADEQFGGLIAPQGPPGLRARRMEAHRTRLAEYERVEALLSGHPEWRVGLDAARLGIRFERSCLKFWREADAVVPPRLSAAEEAAS